MATVDQLIQDAQKRMDASVEHTKTEFNTVRTGRASAALLDRVQIDYYGQQTPLKQLATINVPEPRHADDPTVRPELDQGDREGSPGVGPRPDAVERRQGHPPADAAADRGAPQGARQGRAQDRGGGKGRGAKRAS